ncbi:MAG: hypothetical protein WBO54_14050 [Thermoanaerobaculia bacterium]
MLNLFDLDSVTGVFERVNSCGNDELSDPSNWQQPRRYKFGVRVEF